MMGVRKLERRDITKLTDIERHTLNNIYKGNIKSIKLEYLDKLCYVLNCTPNDLFRYTPD